MVGFDPHALIGLTGAPVVESIVNFLKDQWRLSPKLAPIAAILLGLILNIWAGYVLKVDFVSTIYSGLITGFAASSWYELTKLPTTNNVIK